MRYGDGGSGSFEMKRTCALFALLALSACATTPPVAEHTVYKDRFVEVPRPCPVTKPVRPGKLARPLPIDPGALVSLLVGKLTEWDGPGGFGDRADSAIATCTAPNAPQSPAPAR